MEYQRYKFPKTPHLPWSESKTDDDRTLESIDHLLNREVVVTEKMDGENTTVYWDGYVHTRSLDGTKKPWQSRLRSKIPSLLPFMGEGSRLVFENLQAVHSIEYPPEVPPFVLIAAVDTLNNVIPWNQMVKWANRLSVPLPRVLYVGRFTEAAMKALQNSPNREGYVVRMLHGQTAYINWEYRTAKWVRKNHVQSDHWTHNWVQKK